MSLPALAVGADQDFKAGNAFAQFFDYWKGAVGAVIVHHDDLQVMTRLIQKRPRGFYRGFGVVRWQIDGDQRIANPLRGERLLS